MSRELTTIARQPAQPASCPFHEGYLAAARATKSGPFWTTAPCPYSKGSLPSAVWHEGVAEWAMDLDAGLTPPSWRI